MQKILFLLVAILGSAFGNDCSETKCKTCLKENGCAWFVDPLNELASCITDDDCDDLEPGTPSSCTKTSFVATFPDFEGLGKAKKAAETCKIFPRKLKKAVTVPPTEAPTSSTSTATTLEPPPTDAPPPTVAPTSELNCGAFFPAPFDCELEFRDNRNGFRANYCGGCDCDPQQDCNPEDFPYDPPTAPRFPPGYDEDQDRRCGRFYKSPFDCILFNDFRGNFYCGGCNCSPRADCSNINRIEIGSMNDDEPPVYLFEGESDLDCGADPSGQDCLAQECDLDGYNCGEPFCGGALCDNAP